MRVRGKNSGGGPLWGAPVRLNPGRRLTDVCLVDLVSQHHEAATRCEAEHHRYVGFAKHRADRIAWVDDA